MNYETLQKRCYVPYSDNPGVCLVESQGGHFFPGIRIENISFPLTITAVQCGIFCCISEGGVPEKIHVHSSFQGDLDYWQNEYGTEVVRDGDLSFNTLFPITAEPADVKETLKDLLDRAVIPHSGFPVSAILDTPDGWVTGVNIESNSWNNGLCAERVAIIKALAYGITDFNSLHLHTRFGDFSSPCGACRQVIVEHLPNHPVFIHHPDGTTSRHNSHDLLPYSFKSDFLKKEL